MQLPGSLLQRPLAWRRRPSDWRLKTSNASLFGSHGIPPFRSKWRLFLSELSRHIRQVRQHSVNASSPRSKSLTDSANSESCRSGICIALITEAKKGRGAYWDDFAAVGTDKWKKQHNARHHEQQT